MALKLIVELSTNDNVIDSWFEKIYDFIFEDDKNFGIYFNENKNGNTELYELRDELLFNISELEIALQTAYNEENIHISVAGGFSSGKSSFLNSLLSVVGDSEFLPTGIQPTSVLPTYIVCGGKEISQTIIGVNKSNSLITLNQDVLSVIGHDFERIHHVKIAQLLNKLIIELPNEKLKGFTFIDTPGYDKAEKSNTDNLRTDKDTALLEVKRGEILFWIIDINKGAVSATDIEFIKAAGDKPKLIIFNKADTIPESKLNGIIKLAAKTLNVDQDETYIDVIAYSSSDKVMLYSYKGKEFTTILKNIRKEKNSITSEKQVVENIKYLLEDYSSNIGAEIEFLEKELKDTNSRIIGSKKEKVDFQDDIDSLDEILSTAESDYNYLSSKVLAFAEIARNSLYREIDWNNESGMFSSVDRLLKARNIDYDYYYKCMEKFDKNKKSLLKHEYFVNSITDVKQLIKQYEESLNNVDYLDNSRKRDLDELERLYDSKKKIDELSIKMTELIENSIYLYKKQSKINNNKFAKDFEINNIFICIEKGNLENFIECFSIKKGVDVNIKNYFGYSPLTFAIAQGQNEMVQFLIDEGADVYQRDRRGQNALHTAIENQFKNIVEMLLKFDPQLIHETNEKGLSPIEIAKENNEHFTNWLNKK